MYQEAALLTGRGSLSTKRLVSRVTGYLGESDLPICPSDCEVDQTRRELMTNHADAIAAYSGVKISPEGRWTAPGFTPPKGVMPLHLRIEVRFTSHPVCKPTTNPNTKCHNRGRTWRASLKGRRW